jgi:integrase
LELALVWEAAGNLGEPFAAFYRALIYTGQRREEVAALPWDELSRSDAEWRLPASRAKNGAAHIVPLAPQMIALFDGIAGGKKWPRKGLVFTTTGKTPISGFSRAKLRLDKEMAVIEAKRAADAGEDPQEVSLWRVHDLRRTLATGMQRLNVRLEVTEAVLNHVSGSRAGIVGVYQRHDWKDEKRSALAAWARHVDLITGQVPASENVTELRPAAAA